MFGRTLQNTLSAAGCGDGMARTRRRLLQATGTATLVALAGCAGTDSTPDGESDDSMDDETMDDDSMSNETMDDGSMDNESMGGSMDDESMDNETMNNETMSDDT